MLRVNNSQNHFWSVNRTSVILTFIYYKDTRSQKLYKTNSGTSVIYYLINCRNNKSPVGILGGADCTLSSPSLVNVSETPTPTTCLRSTPPICTAVPPPIYIARHDAFLEAKPKGPRHTRNTTRSEFTARSIFTIVL